MKRWPLPIGKELGAYPSSHLNRNRGNRNGVSLTSQSVRFYSHVICPLCETKRRGLSAAALVFGFPIRTAAGAVGKWESRAFGEISKGVWEPEETCFWFSPASMLPPFPRRSLFSRGCPSAAKRPTR